jgi:hypothetical protein
MFDYETLPSGRDDFVHLFPNIFGSLAFKLHGKFKAAWNLLDTGAQVAFTKLKRFLVEGHVIEIEEVEDLD